jgi:hypothetical protein
LKNVQISGIKDTEIMMTKWVWRGVEGALVVTVLGNILANDMINKKLWEELFAYFPSYDTGHIENNESNNLLLLCVYSLPR